MPQAERRVGGTTPPTVDEVLDLILRKGKAPGDIGITAEVLGASGTHGATPTLVYRRLLTFF